MRLPESFHSLLPPGVDAALISDCILLHSESVENLLLRLPTGPRLLTRKARDARFELTAEVRELRAEGGVLRVRGSSGETSIPLTSWLDRELVRDFLADAAVPTGRVSVPPPAAPVRSAAPTTTAAAPSTTAAPATSSAAPAPTVASSSSAGGPMRLTLRLTGGHCQNPILAIKAVREMASLGLKEAKDLVEQGGSTTVVGGPQLARQINELDRSGCTYEVIPG